MLRYYLTAAISVLPCIGCAADAEIEHWQSIFNGKNLDGWTPKISGYPLNEDPLNTFVVQDGLLTVSYRHYQDFNEQFGHLFYQTKLSHYKLRFSYRFIGEQLPDGPKWAYKNSGAMLHSQAPETMSLRQAFPDSIEAQLLGADQGDTRPTANVCTPNTNVTFEGKPATNHCTDSRSNTYPTEQWVQVEFEVIGHQQITHWVNGEQVMQYSDLVMDDPDNEFPVAPKLSSGYIALQSESHPVQFKDIELLDLSGKQHTRP
ncbi:3-keto-disaccharide hydrolase [Planctobacterium marinum]|uniref:3-keto-disaccharide hydrolase n=1 Tax=Planctobacterium marinum TaxID=1631968 RepID=UPI001E603741|nr:DUF1080 domain-containing protein [Planctobacterium marinum]MCC2606546.1 DUF1080 domain-containing protein [Planctobacterium marinum]